MFQGQRLYFASPGATKRTALISIPRRREKCGKSTIALPRPAAFAASKNSFHLAAQVQNWYFSALSVAAAPPCIVRCHVVAAYNRCHVVAAYNRCHVVAAYNMCHVVAGLCAAHTHLTF